MDEESEGTLSWYEIYVIVNLMIQNGVACSVDASLSAYYVLYLKDKYNSGIILSTSQIAFSILPSIIGMEYMKMLSKKYCKHVTPKNYKYDINNIKVSITIFGYLFNLIFYLWIVPQNLFQISYKISFWIYMSVGALWFGVVLMCVELMLVEIQPLRLAGRMNGTKSWSRSIFRSISVLSIGLLWNDSYDWLWYVQGVLYGTGLCLMVTLAVTESLSGKRVFL